MAVPIWVVQINRAEGWVRWRFPNQPFDVERLAPFEAVHSTLGAALDAVARLLPSLAAMPENVLADTPSTSTAP